MKIMHTQNIILLEIRWQFMSQVFASHDTKYVILLNMLLHFNLDLGYCENFLDSKYNNVHPTKMI